MRFSDDFLADLRDRITISDVIGSRVTWDNKKTKRARGDWWACCPLHGENSPSFHCEDKKGRYHCFGCGASGDHFRFFMELDGVSFRRAVELVADLAGVSLPTQREETPQERAERELRQQEREQRKADQERKAERDAERKADTVKDIWSQGGPIAGTLAEAYLLSRGLPRTEWPASLRFHPRVRYTLDSPFDFNCRYFPALICGVQASNRKLIAIWQIFLDPSGGKAKVRPGESAKIGFGPAGGGAVRLGPAAEEIDTCEGVETGFGVGNLNRWKRPVWPLLSTSGMIGFIPPPGVKRIHNWSDGDRHRFTTRGDVMGPPGREAAEKLKANMARLGIEVINHEPPEGSDWLDVWNSMREENERQRSVQYL